MRSRVYVTVGYPSARLSHRSTVGTAAVRFAAERRRMQELNIDSLGCRAVGAGAWSFGPQRHVESQWRRFNTDFHSHCVWWISELLAPYDLRMNSSSSLDLKLAFGWNFPGCNVLRMCWLIQFVLNVKKYVVLCISLSQTGPQHTYTLMLT